MEYAERCTRENLDLQSFGRSDDLHELLEAYQMGSQKSAHNLSLAASNSKQLHLKVGPRFYWILT